MPIGMGLGVQPRPFGQQPNSFTMPAQGFSWGGLKPLGQPKPVSQPQPPDATTATPQGIQTAMKQASEPGALSGVTSPANVPTVVDRLVQMARSRRKHEIYGDAGAYPAVKASADSQGCALLPCLRTTHKLKLSGDICPSTLSSASLPAGAANVKYAACGKPLLKNIFYKSGNTHMDPIAELLQKLAAQDNNASQRTATGEANGISVKTNDDDYSSGHKAWKETTKYLKKKEGTSGYLTRDDLVAMGRGKAAGFILPDGSGFFTGTVGTKKKNPQPDTVSAEGADAAADLGKDVDILTKDAGVMSVLGHLLMQGGLLKGMTALEKHTPTAVKDLATHRMGHAAQGALAAGGGGPDLRNSDDKMFGVPWSWSDAAAGGLAGAVGGSKATRPLSSMMVGGLAGRLADVTGLFSGRGRQMGAALGMGHGLGIPSITEPISKFESMGGKVMGPVTEAMKHVGKVGEKVWKEVTSVDHGPTMPGRMISRLVPIGTRRNQLEPDEDKAVAKGQSQWIPRLVQTDETPIPELMASPTKQGIIGGLGGAAVGGGVGALLGGGAGALAGHAAGGDWKSALLPGLIGAAAGGGAGMIPGAAVGGIDRFVHQRKHNAHLEEIMRRLPPQSTKHDYVNAEMLWEALMNRFGGDKVASDLEPFAGGFFTRCATSGLNVGQVADAIHRVGMTFGKEASDELIDGFEKIAGIGSLVSSALSLIPRKTTQTPGPNPAAGKPMGNGPGGAGGMGGMAAFMPKRDPRTLSPAPSMHKPGGGMGEIKPRPAAPRASGPIASSAGISKTAGIGSGLMNVGKKALQFGAEKMLPAAGRAVKNPIVDVTSHAIPEAGHALSNVTHVIPGSERFATNAANAAKPLMGGMGGRLGAGAQGAVSGGFASADAQNDGMWDWKGSVGGAGLGLLGGQRGANIANRGMLGGMAGSVADATGLTGGKGRQFGALAGLGSGLAPTSVAESAIGKGVSDFAHGAMYGGARPLSKVTGLSAARQGIGKMLPQVAAGEGNMVGNFFRKAPGQATNDLMAGGKGMAQTAAGGLGRAAGVGATVIGAGSAATSAIGAGYQAMKADVGDEVARRVQEEGPKVFEQKLAEMGTSTEELTAMLQQAKNGGGLGNMMGQVNGMCDSVLGMFGISPETLAGMHPAAKIAILLGGATMLGSAAMGSGTGATLGGLAMGAGLLGGFGPKMMSSLNAPAANPAASVAPGPEMPPMGGVQQPQPAPAAQAQAQPGYRNEQLAASGQQQPQNSPVGMMQDA